MDEVFKTIGVDPKFYGVLAALGILNAILKAKFVGFRPSYGLIMAVLFAGVFGGASWITHGLTYWDGAVHTFLLLVAAVAVEFGLDMLGLKNNALAGPSGPKGGPPVTPSMLLALAVLAVPMIAQADGIVDKLYIGAGGVWFDGPATAHPADVEASGLASASLSPHLSVVGGLHYGFVNTYFRYQGGVRVTATDVNNPDFNTFLGLAYRGTSKPEIGISEWAPDAGFGWRAFKSEWPNILLTGDAGYGLTSKRVIASLGVRYAFPIKGF